MDQGSTRPGMAPRMSTLRLATTDPGVGAPKGLRIVYVGPEPMRQAGPETNWSLTLAEVNPLLSKWGFR
jgi:hypothetical protein